MEETKVNEDYEISQKISRIIFLMKELNDIATLDRIQFTLFKDESIFVHLNGKLMEFKFDKVETEPTDTRSIAQRLTVQHEVRKFIEDFLQTE